MGQELLDLHIGFESAEPFPLQRVETGREPGKPKLRADKERGVIVLDDATRLTGVPERAWAYRLGSRSALEWVLDQYKERKPKDPTIAARFNMYRFADYKERVIDLLRRVCMVSVDTMEHRGRDGVLGGRRTRGVRRPRQARTGDARAVGLVQQARGPRMGGCMVGVVVLAPLPYTDLSDAKIRPCLVLADVGMGDWVAVRDNQQYRQTRLGDIELRRSDMRHGELRFDSQVRPGRLHTLNDALFDRIVGPVSGAKRAEVMAAVRGLFA